MEKPLRQLAGVEFVKIDLETGRVSVKVSSTAPPTEQQLREAVDASGFTLDRIDNP